MLVEPLSQEKEINEETHGPLDPKVENKNKIIDLFEDIKLVYYIFTFRKTNMAFAQISIIIFTSMVLIYLISHALLISNIMHVLNGLQPHKHRAHTVVATVPCICTQAVVF